MDASKDPLRQLEYRLRDGREIAFAIKIQEQGKAGKWVPCSEMMIKKKHGQDTALLIIIWDQCYARNFRIFIQLLSRI